jgi:tetratricopeptide (TPR) repeat protein
MRRLEGIGYGGLLLLRICATIQPVREGMNRRRTALKLTLLALDIVLLGLMPYPGALATALRQGVAHGAARDYGAALDAYRQAARLQPESPFPWMQTGEILLRQHRFVEAASAFYEAARRGAGEMAFLGLGESLAGRGDWAAALRAWLRAQARAPDDARIYVALARGSIAQAQFDQAGRYLARAIEGQSDGDVAAAAHALMGRLLIQDNPVRAAGHFRQAGDEDMLAVLAVADAEPDPARRALLLGAAFLQRSELPLARRAFEQAVTLAPADAEAQTYLAHTLDELGETIAAGEMLERASHLDPDSALVYYFLGVHYRQMGSPKRAQAALWTALLRDLENAALRVEMAEAFVDLHDYPGAEEWYVGAVEVASGDIEFQLLLAHFYLDHLYRVEGGGLPAAQAAVALAPLDARTHDMLGWAYHLTGRQSQGQQFLAQALLLDPDLVSAHYHLGSLYARVGRRELARQHLQRAADLDTGGYYRARAEALLHDLR